MVRPRPPIRRQTYFLVYALLAAFLVLAHGPILDVPFYWDETGQFIPASLDLLRSGALIPHSTLPNVHPPGVMAYLALVWRIVGFSIQGTRIAMLILASAGALVSFLLSIELSREAPGAPAFASVAMLCISPLFFAQSMLAQLDLPAMCFSVLALLLFLQDRIRAAAIVCVALVLTKETGIATPFLFAAWLIAEKRRKDAAWFALPAVALALWLCALKGTTGHWLGNAEFTHYNLFYPLNPARLSIALLRRLYYLFFSTGHIIGTAVLVWAWRRMPLFRNRPWRIATAFLAINVLTVSVLGGAVLERYLLPVLPLIYIAFSIACQALLPRRKQVAIAALLICLGLANFVNPPYPFPYENNLAFVDFVQVEQAAAATVELRPGIIATAFPMADALRRPEFGFVDAKRKVVELKSFRKSEIVKLNGARPDMLLLFDTAWDPLRIFSSRPAKWTMRKFYDYEPPLTPEEAARLLSMQVSQEFEYHGMKMTLLVRDHVR